MNLWTERERDRKRNFRERERQIDGIEGVEFKPAATIIPCNRSRQSISMVYPGAEGGKGGGMPRAATPWREGLSSSLDYARTTVLSSRGLPEYTKIMSRQQPPPYKHPTTEIFL